MRRASTWLMVAALLAPASLVSAQDPVEPPQENPFAPEPRPRRPRPAAAEETAPAEPAPREAAPAEEPPRPARPARPGAEPAETARPARPAPSPEPAPAETARPAPSPEPELAPAQAIEPATEGEEPLSDEALDQALDEALGDEEFAAPVDEFGNPIEEPAEEPLEAQAPDHGSLEDGLVDDEAAADEAHANEHELVPADDHAEHGEHAAGAEAHHGFDFVGFLPTVVNFLLLLAILVWLLRKPMTEFLRNRRLAVVEGLEESKRLKAAAEAKYKEYSERLEHLDEELAKLRKEMIQAGEAERDRIIEEAEARAARMRRDAQFVIDQQLKQLRADLTREAIEAAVAAAGSVLAEQTGAADQQRLADDYLGKLADSVKDEEVRA